MPPYVILSYLTPSHATQRHTHATPGHFTSLPCHPTSPHAIPCHAIPFDATQGHPTSFLHYSMPPCTIPTPHDTPYATHTTQCHFISVPRHPVPPHTNPCYSTTSPPTLNHCHVTQHQPMPSHATQGHPTSLLHYLMPHCTIPITPHATPYATHTTQCHSISVPHHPVPPDSIPCHPTSSSPTLHYCHVNPCHHMPLNTN